MEKYKDMCDNPDFNQDHWSRTVEGIYIFALGSIRLMK